MLGMVTGRWLTENSVVSVERWERLGVAKLNGGEVIPLVRGD
jgi:hypothetical protein